MCPNIPFPLLSFQPQPLGLKPPCLPLKPLCQTSLNFSSYLKFSYAQIDDVPWLENIHEDYLPLYTNYI